MMMYHHYLIYLFISILYLDFFNVLNFGFFIINPNFKYFGDYIYIYKLCMYILYTFRLILFLNLF